MLRSVLATFIALIFLTGSVGAQPVPIEIPTMLAITGNAAFLGQGLATTLKVVEQFTNAHGGIKGRPVKFVIEDTQSNPSLPCNSRMPRWRKNRRSCSAPVLGRSVWRSRHS